MSPKGRRAPERLTLAGVGDTIVWEMVATNSGPQRITYLFINDTMPAGIDITAISPVTSSQDRDGAESTI